MDTMETPSAESSLQLVLKKNNANKYCSSKGVDLKLCSLIKKKNTAIEFLYKQPLSMRAGNR